MQIGPSGVTVHPTGDRSYPPWNHLPPLGDTGRELSTVDSRPIFISKCTSHNFPMKVRSKTLSPLWQKSFFTFLWGGGSADPHQTTPTWRHRYACCLADSSRTDQGCHFSTSSSRSSTVCRRPSFPHRLCPRVWDELPRHVTSRLHRLHRVYCSRLKTQLFSRSFLGFRSAFEVTSAIIGHFKPPFLFTYLIARSPEVTQDPCSCLTI